MSAASGDAAQKPTPWRVVHTSIGAQVVDANGQHVTACGRTVAEMIVAAKNAAAVSPAAPGDDNRDLLYEAWGLIANAGQGDWEREHPDWQEAAVRWRDRWHATVVAPAAGGSPAPVCRECGDTGMVSDLRWAMENASADGEPAMEASPEPTRCEACPAPDGLRSMTVCTREGRVSGRTTVGDSRLPLMTVVGYVAVCGKARAREAYPSLTEEEAAVAGQLARDMAADAFPPAPSVDALTEAVERLADRWVERARRNFADACGLPSSDFNAEEFRRLNELADDYAERAAELRALLSAPGVTRSAHNSEEADRA